MIESFYWLNRLGDQYGDQGENVTSNLPIVTHITVIGTGPIVSWCNSVEFLVKWLTSSINTCTDSKMTCTDADTITTDKITMMMGSKRVRPRKYHIAWSMFRTFSCFTCWILIGVSFLDSAECPKQEACWSRIHRWIDHGWNDRQRSWEYGGDYLGD